MLFLFPQRMFDNLLLLFEPHFSIRKNQEAIYLSLITTAASREAKKINDT
jgi:hypothetical protein